MYLVDRVEVEGFWDTHKVRTGIHPDVTFFIGPNGTGKTTLINLIAAGLTADFPTLDRISFKQLTITLRGDRGSKRPTITVRKTPKKERPFAPIEYRIKNDDAGSETRFSLEETEEQFFLRQIEYHTPYYHDYPRRMPTGLIRALQNLVKVNWLSIHRASLSDHAREGRTYESTVDRKLETQSNELVRYFATLSKQRDDEVRSFQQHVFVSLLALAEQGPFAKQITLESLKDNRQAMRDIFRELGVKRSSDVNLIEAFFDRADDIAKAVKSPRFELRSAIDVSLLFQLQRIDDVVARWEKLQLKLADVFGQRKKFVDILNSLLQRKQMSISDSNELVFTTRTDKRLPAQMLSSGEKQLLILLSEALLQRQTPAIFIADEPELSLHVSWQERLVSSLRDLNNSAQIIAATHSPDIVGHLSTRAIDMESIIP